MPTPGKLELVLKINEFPKDVATVQNGWREFKIESNGFLFSISVRPGIFKFLEEAQAKYPHWVAAIKGQLGPLSGTTFTILQPTIQVFEHKPKEPKATGSTSAPETNPQAPIETP